jgi:hypothetical protein
MRRQALSHMKAHDRSVLLEPLESRSLLSAWPLAPFSPTTPPATIYTNQDGDAVLNSRRINSPGKIDLYSVYFDDPGTMWFGTNGTLHSQVAFYDHPGKPTAVNLGQGKYSRGLLRGLAVSANKLTMNLAVQMQDGAAKGAYGLVVRGPAAEYVERVPISPKNNAGASGSDISGLNDSDFYRFTTTRAGDWNISVIPDPVKAKDNVRLDATMNIFDDHGNPVAGTFLRPINAKGPGGTETWIGANLPAGQTYYIRVDGFGDSVGGYGVSMVWNPLPRISIAATDPLASDSPTDIGLFTVTRSATDDISKPLKVSYRVAGTSSPGIDYSPISALVTIPANQAFATIAIKPIPGTLDLTDKTVVLRILGNSQFIILQNTATVTIAGHNA